MYILSIIPYIILISLHGIKCYCIETHITICDSLLDVKDYDTNTWNSLQISNNFDQDTHLDQYDYFHDNYQNLHVVNDSFFDMFRNLHSLTIINTLHIFDVKNRHPWLDSLTLYRNSFTFVNVTLYENFEDLHKLSLANNQITKVYSQYSGSSLRILDLRDNLLEVLEERIFFNSSIESINLRKNKLSTIAPTPFPSSLLVLHLDHNLLYEFDDDVLENLVNLEELTLSHNQFTLLPKVKKLVKIKLLDLSYNELTVVSDVFSKLGELHYLDLSHNKIKKFDNNLRRVENLYWDIRVSLAFNLMDDLDYYAIIALFGHTELNHKFNNTISMYGNPFICGGFSQIHRYFFNHYINFTRCDLEYFNSGKTPYCVIDNNDTLTGFFEEIKKTEGLVPCDLKRNFYQEVNTLVPRRRNNKNIC